MPNGYEGQERRAYNFDWCQDKHEKISGEFKAVWDRMKGMEKVLIGIMLALVGNLGGVIATLVVVAVK